MRIAYLTLADASRKHHGAAWECSRCATAVWTPIIKDDYVAHKLQNWRVTHRVRAEFDIEKRAAAFRGGWSRLGSMCHYTRGYQWRDLAGMESTVYWRSQKACLLAFVLEMEARRG